jgi:hypothetical protein
MRPRSALSDSAPGDVASVVTFLVSAAFLTGVCLDLDEGRSIE